MKFFTVKTLFNNLIELYLLISVLFYWYSSTFYNPVAFVLIAVAIFQLVTKNTITGLIIGTLFVIVNLYLALALASELSEFLIRDREWKTLLIVGVIYIALNILVGVRLIVKSVRNRTKHMS